METVLPCRELATLRAVPLFATLPLPAQEALVREARQRTYAKGAIVINEGDAAHGLFIVCSGLLKACLNDEQGRELILSTHGPGDHFGELALLDDAPRSANVAALEATELLIITKAAFHSVLQSHPDCMWAIVRSLVARVRELTENVRALALVDVFGRLARLLTTLAADEAGQQVIRPRPTQQDIASRIGASREMVSRILKDLVLGGYLSLDADCIRIHRKFPHRW
ncbi:MAG: Crp/Fnr family transcriptional regulator [Pseudomonadota bacterium]